MQHSKFAPAWSGWGQKPALPRRSIAVRFAPNKQTLSRAGAFDQMSGSRGWRRGKGEGLQIAAVLSVRSLLRPHCFAELAAVTCGSPK